MKHYEEVEWASSSFPAGSGLPEGFVLLSFDLVCHVNFTKKNDK